MKSTLAVLALLCGAFSASAQPLADNRLISDADFKAFLAQLEDSIPKWDAEFRGVDVDKNEQISYAVGKMIVDRRNLCLSEIEDIRSNLARLRAKRTVSGELALLGFLQSLYDMAEETENIEDAAGVELSHFEKYAPSLGSLQMRLGNDVTARVELLEKATCP